MMIDHPNILFIDSEEVPLDLVTLADPDPLQYMKYFESSIWIGYRKDARMIGILAFSKKGLNHAEINNIAVAPNHQSRGIGRVLLQEAISLCAMKGWKKLSISTGNSSIGQLALYQKMGFQMKELDLDYFVREYPEPIWENGIQCRHRVVLHMDLT